LPRNWQSFVKQLKNYVWVELSAGVAESTIAAF